VACGIAVEAFAAPLQKGLPPWLIDKWQEHQTPHYIRLAQIISKMQVESPPRQIDKWQENRTPHYIRIAEVISRALSLNSNATKTLHQNLSEILRFRDLAVGATTKADVPILHPELQTGVEWRFVYFRYENASMIVRATSRLIWELTAFGRPRDAELQTAIGVLRSRIEAIPGYLAFTARPRDRDTPAAASFTSVDTLPALLFQQAG